MQASQAVVGFFLPTYKKSPDAIDPGIRLFRNPSPCFEVSMIGGFLPVVGFSIG
jgi:hypothetical protein